MWVNGCWGRSHFLVVIGEALPDTRPLRPMGISRRVSPNSHVRELGRAPPTPRSSGLRRGCGDAVALPISILFLPDVIFILLCFCIRLVVKT